MKFFTLIMTLSFVSAFYGSEFTDQFLGKPENCAEYLQIVYGEQDKPSGKYSLTIEKGEDMHVKDMWIPTYHLRADGIPGGNEFKIACRNALGRTIVVASGVHLGDGKIVHKFGGMSTCEPLVMGGFERGEPCQLLFIDQKNNTTDAAFYVPYPVEPAIMNSLKVSMYYVSVDPPVYFFDMENLRPGEQVLIKSDGGSDSVVVSKSGMVGALLGWLSKAAPSGESTFEVQRASGRTLAITFPWVRESCNLPTPLVIFTINHAPTPEEIEFARKAYIRIMVPDEQEQ